jgi:hypothetical protein
MMNSAVFQRDYWSAALEQLKGPKPVLAFTPATSG